jgi:hypothetical protein
MRNAKRMERQERRANRHRDLLAQISHYLAWELLPVVAAHVLDVPITPDDEIAWGLSGHKKASECAPRDGGTNNLTASSRAENTVPPPGPYSDPLPAQPLANPQSLNNLPHTTESIPPD